MKIFDKKSNQEIATFHWTKLTQTLLVLKLEKSDVTCVLEPKELEQKMSLELNTYVAQNMGIFAESIAAIAISIAQLSIGLSQAKSIEDIRKAATPMAQIGVKLTDAINASKLPLLSTEKVLSDLTQWINGMTEILKQG